jgi:hypothetical protein
MRYLWQIILHRWYMGRWPDQYVEGYDPVISHEIDKLLADILEE